MNQIDEYLASLDELDDGFKLFVVLASHKCPILLMETILHQLRLVV